MWFYADYDNYYSERRDDDCKIFLNYSNSRIYINPKELNAFSTIFSNYGLKKWMLFTYNHKNYYIELLPNPRRRTIWFKMV